MIRFSNRRGIPALLAGAALVATLVCQGVLNAHEGHTHKLLGTVTAIRGTQVDLKTTAGKTVTVLLNDKTVITRGKERVDPTALKEGLRVSVDALQQKGQFIAQSVKLGAASPPPS